MKRSTQTRIPRRGNVKQYSFNQVISAVTIGIFASLIFGTVLGLKLGSSSQRNAKVRNVRQEKEQLSMTPHAYTPVENSARYTDLTTRRTVASPQNSSYSSSSYSGKRPFESYQAEAEDVAKHWEQETGQRMSDYDVKTIQGIIKVVDDEE